ncbi:MAG: hypothetical protein ACRC46_05195 [Thermoguttaceae bacterium]
MMRSHFILLFFLVSFGHGVMSQEKALDSNLLREIVKGHQFLEHSTECLSGKIERFRKQEGRTAYDTTPERQLLFFRDHELLRLDYLRQREGTEILPGYSSNDITEVILRSKEHDLQYTAVSTTGVPYANLFKSKLPDSKLEMVLQTDCYRTLNALFALPGGRILDVLQRDIGGIECRQYNDVTDALWIFGPESTSASGDVANWKIVLNPQQHYALLYHEACVKNEKTGFSITTTITATTQTTDAGDVFPNEIRTESQIMDQSSGERYIVSALSTAKPDGKLFTEESFKELGRDYAVVDVLPNQTQVGGHVVNAAPLEARMPEYLLPKNPRLAWPWSRIFLLFTGVILIIAVCVCIYLQQGRTSK